jgi:hypothetical protein
METVELKFDESGGLHEKHAVTAWDLGTIRAFAWRQNRTEKLCVEMADRRAFRMHTDIQPAV